MKKEVDLDNKGYTGEGLNKVYTVEESVPSGSPELIKYTDLMKTVSTLQRSYLTLRVLGLDSEKAFRAIGRAKQLMSRWKEVSNFSKAYELVLSYKDVYFNDARMYFVGELRDKALFVLNLLVDKGLHWDTMERWDKPYVMKAIEMSLRLGDVAEGGKVASYEELVFRARRVINDVPDMKVYQKEPREVSIEDEVESVEGEIRELEVENESAEGESVEQDSDNP